MQTTLIHTDFRATVTPDIHGLLPPLAPPPPTAELMHYSPEVDGWLFSLFWEQPAVGSERRASTLLLLEQNQKEDLNLKEVCETLFLCRGGDFSNLLPQTNTRWSKGEAKHWFLLSCTGTWTFKFPKYGSCKLSQLSENLAALESLGNNGIMSSAWKKGC